MMSIDQIHEFLGYCTVINLAVLLFSTFAVTVFKDKVSTIHAKMFDLSLSEVKAGYFSYLSHYKVLLIVFNLVPYLALTLMR